MNWFCPSIVLRQFFPYASRKKLLDFVAGDGQVPDALELAIMDMKKGEKETPQGEGLG